MKRLFLFPAFLLLSCLPEKPDPAAQAAAILHKHPSDFLDQLSALDAMAAREAAPVEAHASGPLIESVYRSAARLGPALKAAPDDSTRIELLNAWIYDTLGIVPLLNDSNLASSVPSLVLSEKRGSCVGLVLLYLALGRALDLPLRPVFLPGHVFVRWRAPLGGANGRNIETLRRGIRRSDAFYDSAFSLGRRPWYALKDAEPRQALGALVFNLGNTHRARGETKWALEEFRLAEESIPGLPEALGSQGVAYMLLGDCLRARELMRKSLDGDSLSAPALANLKALESSDSPCR